MAPPTNRLLAAATAFAFVLAGMLGALHQSVSKHIRCAEHGELTHADEAGETHAHAQRETVAHEAPGPSLHEHEHCILATALRTSSLASRIAPELPLHLAIARESVAFVAPPPAAPGHLYRTAPKTSPPA